MLSDEEIFNSDDLIAFNAQLGLPTFMFGKLVRAIESAACAERDARIAELEKWQAEHWNALEIINNYFVSKDLLLVVEDGGPDAAARNIVHSVAALEQQLEEARKDAELYGQLKALAHKNSAYDIYGNGCLWTIGLHSADSSLSFDAAIRAAIKEQTK